MIGMQSRIAALEAELAGERKTVNTLIGRILEWKEKLYQVERERDEARRELSEERGADSLAPANEYAVGHPHA
jgi:chromosome segregation ATPase